MYSLSYNSLTEIKSCQSVSKLSGSSRYKHIGAELVKRKYSKSILEIAGNVYEKYLSALKTCDHWEMPYNPDAVELVEPHGYEVAANIRQYRRISDGLRASSGKTVRTYQLNKTKVRKKISAMCRLSQAVKFIAFYSISFPVNAPDDVLYKIFNSWLTNCRKRYGLKTYLWVAERQKNATLHFHLLTTNKMNIKEVNKAMAQAIGTEVSKKVISWGNSSAEKYNGVDVDSPQQPKKRQNENREQYRKRLSKRGLASKAQIIKWISGYLTKYLTKNNIEFKRLPWHCSRDISALFTSVVIADDDLHFYIEHLPDDADSYKIINKEDVTINIFLFSAPDALFRIIDYANDMIFDFINDDR